MHIFLLHGYKGHANNCFFPWAKEQLTQLGHTVQNPALPEPNAPQLDQWLKTLSTALPQDIGDVILIGHSLGAILALRALEQLPENTKVKSAFLIGCPWDNRGRPIESFFTPPFDFNKIRNSAEHITMIHSKDDPIVPLEHAEKYASALQATLVTEENYGHFDIPRYEHLLELIQQI